MVIGLGVGLGIVIGVCLLGVALIILRRYRNNSTLFCMTQLLLIAEVTLAVSDSLKRSRATFSFLSELSAMKRTPSGCIPPSAY